MRYFIYAFLSLLVIFRYLTTLPNYKDGDTIRITGRVTTEPFRYQYSQRIEVAGLGVYLDKFPEVNYGDEVTLTGVVKAGELRDAELSDHRPGTNFLLNIRQQIISFYNKVLPEPHNALVAGVVLGSKAGISRDFREDLINSGTIHVVVASGMNVTLVAGFLLNSTVTVLPRKKAIPLALAGVWLYVLLSGLDAPLVRAAIMGSIAFTAQVVGRLNDALRALFVSALIMLLVNPRWAGDLGFQLSFLATLSLILFESKVYRLTGFVPVKMLRKDLSTTLAAQLGVLPLLIGVFGRVSLAAPVTNTLVLWTIAPIMIIGSLGGIAGLVFEPLGRVITLLVFPMTEWFILIINLIAPIKHQ